MKTYLNALLHRPDVVSGVPAEPNFAGVDVGPADSLPPDEDVDVEVAPIPAPGEDDE